MPILNITAPDGRGGPVDAREGMTVMEAIRDSGFEDLLALCGGGCSCGTCHVYVDAIAAAHGSPMSSDETDLLAASMHRRDNSRLSCQMRVIAALDGAVITIAPQD